MLYVWVFIFVTVFFLYKYSHDISLFWTSQSSLELCHAGLCENSLRYRYTSSLALLNCILISVNRLLFYYSYNMLLIQYTYSFYSEFGQAADVEVGLLWYTYSSDRFACLSCRCDLSKSIYWHRRQQLPAPRRKPLGTTCVPSAWSEKSRQVHNSVHCIVF